MSGYKKEVKITDAHFPRQSGSTISVDDKLKIVYNKFSPTIPPPEDKIRVNLLFSHGTGMNKEIWNYHIEKLYRESYNQEHWYLGSVISFDCVSHGDSGVMNKDKLGWTYGWIDGGKDIIEIVKHENSTCNDFLNNRTSKNIIIGHSLGGHQVMVAGFLEPQLFDTIIPIEPVFYTPDNRFFYVFIDRFKKVQKYIYDTFKTKEEFYEYYTKFAFTKDMHPRISQDYIDNEFYEVYDPATKSTVYKSKASKVSQMATYLSSYWALEQSTAMIPHMKCKICYVWGEKARWNPPGTEEYFLENAKPESLIEYHCVKDGTHLLNGELPDETVKIIQGVIEKRSKSAYEDKDCYPEIKFKGRPAEEVSQEFLNKMLENKMDEVVHFSKTPLPLPPKM